MKTNNIKTRNVGTDLLFIVPKDLGKQLYAR